MTIEKGAEWGEVVRERLGGIEPEGDLARDLGLTGRTGSSGDRQTVDLLVQWRRLPVDCFEVNLWLRNGDNHRRVISSWVVVGGKWRGEFFIVSNTSHVQGRRLFERSHPNDGKIEVIRFDPSTPLRQRIAFWRRTRSGSHLPHPLVETRSVNEFSTTLEHAKTVRFEEGRSIRNVVRITAKVLPDANFTHIKEI